MSEDVRKQLRTQGRFSDKCLSSDDKNKGRDRKQKVSPGLKVSPESRVPKRNSNEHKGAKNSVTDESMPFKYEENSEYKFNLLDDVKRPEQITGRGKKDLSVTENGTSTIFYEPTFLYEDEAWEYFDRLHNSTKWHTKNIVIQGVEYPQPRLVAWYGPFPYTYSGATLEAAEMPRAVVEIKEKVESYLRECNIDVSFNSVLLNLYRNGKDSVAWHSDDELTMGISPTIASVSLGETRKFEMRPKHDEDGSPSEQTAKYSVHLTHGSLIIMTGCMQDDWQHRVPKEYHDKEARINLTFRTVYPLEKIPERVPAREIKKESPPNYSSKTSHPTKICLDAENFPPLCSTSSPIYPNANKNVHERTVSNSKKNNRNTSEECWDDELSEEGRDAEPLDDDETAQNNNRYEQYENENKNSSFTERHVKESIDIITTHTSEEKPPNAWHRSAPLSSSNSIKDNDCMHEQQPPNPWNKYGAHLPANSIQDDDCIGEEKHQDLWPELDADLHTKETHKNFCYDEVSLSANGSHDNNTDSNNYVESGTPSNINLQNSIDKKSTLNVNAQEFVPCSSVPPYYDYSQYDLTFLVNNQDLIDKMEMEELMAFSLALKAQVLENIHEFLRFAREELDFLCNLTDGTQSLKNQKLISSRICRQVISFFERGSSYTGRSYDRNSRQRAPYGNQSYHSDRGRKYSNQGRSNNHRYN